MSKQSKIYLDALAKLRAMEESVGDHAREANDVFEKAQADLLNGVPEEFRAFIKSVAWDNGHSNGYSNVLWYVDDFVSRLGPQIAYFRRRIRREARDA